MKTKTEKIKEELDIEEGDDLPEMDPRLLPDLPVAESEFNVKFTGAARSLQCFMNNGQFLNFRILTLHIENGSVKRIDYSDPYASFEALTKMELANELSLMRLNDQWEDKKCMAK